MKQPATLESYLEPLKADVAAGDVRLAPGRLALLGAVDPSFPRKGAKRLPRIVFTKHPAFLALGTEIVVWRQAERDTFAELITDAAKLESAIAAAVASARAAIAACR